MPGATAHCDNNVSRERGYSTAVTAYSDSRLLKITRKPLPPQENGRSLSARGQPSRSSDSEASPGPSSELPSSSWPALSEAAPPLLAPCCALFAGAPLPPCCRATFARPESIFDRLFSTRESPPSTVASFSILSYILETVIAI